VDHTQTRQERAEIERADTAAGCPVRPRWLRRVGAAAFLFFLIKGLAWLCVPAVLAALAMKD